MQVLTPRNPHSTRFTIIGQAAAIVALVLGLASCGGGGGGYGGTPTTTAPPRASISAGYGHTVLTKTDSTLWAWGSNVWTELGDGTTVSKSVPTHIGLATTWAAVSAGSGHTLAKKTDGTLWAWGNNGSGQLGDGTVVNKNTPVNIPVQ